ncbi:nucleocapsid [Sand fever Naples-like virus]|uniref:Nucleoprotein n=2 Tax=Phlebovirus napoliense TaxID=3052666 RepID=A7KCM6_9VIRU|nr:nucleocapsid [Sandfly fever Naples virus]AEL29675.1 nucleocapsid [Sand fever Naples-like virus]
MSEENYREIALAFLNEAADSGTITAWVNEFAYQGFDPKRIVQLVKERGTAKGRDWKKDVKMMIVLNLVRGNKPETMMKKMSEKGAGIVAQLISVYQLKEGNPGRDTITLSRVSAAFVPWTVQALRVLSDSLPVTGTTMDAIAGVTYPRAMMHPSFAGIIDLDLPNRAGETIADAHGLFMLEFSKTINPSLRTKQPNEIAATFEKPNMAAMSGRFFTREDKKKLLMAVGVLNEDLVLTPAIVKCAEKYRSKVGK